MAVGITETVLRDAQQCLLATRLRTEDMLPIAEKLDRVGYHSLEVWGGATFDACLRFLREDPWERLRLLKQHIKRTPLQMLLRGQSLVGYRPYADDVVERFIYKARENGIDIFRIFDALNDVRNLETAMRAAKACGAHVQAAICYTISPVHSFQAYVELARRLEEMGADSICIKDMAGLLHPYDAYNLIKALKGAIRVPLQLHTHCTGGMAEMSCLKAVEAGVDVIDCAISTMAGASSQPPTESLVAALQGTPHAPSLDMGLLAEIASYFADVRKRYAPFERGMVGVEADVPPHQMPEGLAPQQEPELPRAEAEAGALARSEEDILTWALFPQVAGEFFRWRAEGGPPERELAAAIAAALHRRLQANPSTHQPPRGEDASPWRLAGRRRVMRNLP